LNEDSFVKERKLPCLRMKTLSKWNKLKKNYTQTRPHSALVSQTANSPHNLFSKDFIALFLRTIFFHRREMLGTVDHKESTTISILDINRPSPNEAFPIVMITMEPAFVCENLH